jgi:hypothetical protein
MRRASDRNPKPLVAGSPIKYIFPSVSRAQREAAPTSSTKTAALPPLSGFARLGMHCYFRAMPVTDPTDPKIDRWLRKQPPRLELAMRYAIRGKFLEHGRTLAHTARIDELFAMLNPSEDELAAIVRRAGEIRLAMEKEIAG